MALIALAEDAHDVASGFLVFQEYLPTENHPDLSALATELFGIKTALLELHAEVKDPRNHRDADSIDEEQYVTVKSISLTFKDIRRHFGELAVSPYRTKQEAYRAVWKKISAHFYKESKNQLEVRLGYYKEFLFELIELVLGHDLRPDFEELFERIDLLLETQENGRLAEDFGQLALGSPLNRPRGQQRGGRLIVAAPRPTRSWERRRPYGLDRTGQPNGRGPPRDQQANHRPGYRRPASPGFPEGGFPLSPVASVSSAPSTVTTSSVTESASSSSMASKHWLVDVWSQQRSNTQFVTTGTESACFGEHTRGASKKLREEHEKLLSLPFDGNLELRIYVRDRDRRARIWCRTERRHGHVEVVQPIAKLRIIRRESCLQICKPDSRQQLRLWANLRFVSYERLVLFHCSFLALKAQEESQRADDLDDHILHGEVTVFSAKIQDDNYVHALQIFKDEDSGGVRLQASVLRGPLKRAPVWTAFIKYHMTAPDWISQLEPKKVLLADLSRYIFTEQYVPQMAPTGDHELHFTSRQDASEFIEAIYDLVDNKV